MRENLKAGTVISFGKDNGKCFTIKSLLSNDGASCLVYLASSLDRLGNPHDVVLKELYPQGLDIERDGYSIIIPEKSRENFELYKSRFKEAYARQVTFRQIEEAINKSSDAREIYEGYNTCFIEMQCDYGYCYNQVKDESLNDILKTAKAIAEAVKVYHDNGFLHLDIKPANIFLLYETKELVKLFDYDSVVSMQNVALGNAQLSFSERWAAPELLMGKNNEICAAADIYSIGVIVFNRIFGRVPVSKDRRHDSRYEFTLNPLFNNINPSIYKLLTQFFNKTLQSTPGERYQTAQELISALDELVTAARPKNIFLANHIFSSSEQFIGRTAELKAIKEKLNHGCCFLHGMGGIGKTEIARSFANMNRDYYHTIYAIKYSGDLKQDIMNMDFINLNNKDFVNEKGEIDTEKLFKYKKDKIQNLDKRTLIIVDNFNTDNDQYINDIISHHNKHHILFTTKNNVFGKAQFYIEINELSPDSCLELFYAFYKDRSDVDTIIEIIEHVQRNTLAIKLIAATMQTGTISPQEMLTRLQNGTGNKIAVKIKHNRNILEQDIDNDTLINHLSIVFDTARLSDEQKYLMMNMSLVTKSEITDKAFLSLLEIDYTCEMYNSFNSLLEQNWIHKDHENDIISLHPVVSNVVKIQIQQEIFKCEELLRNIIIALCNNNDNILTPKQKIFVGEEILKQNQVPEYLRCAIFFGLSLQYNGKTIKNLAKALEYAKKADISYFSKNKYQKNSAKEFEAFFYEDIDTHVISTSVLNMLENITTTFLGVSIEQYYEDIPDIPDYNRLGTFIKENLGLIYFHIQQYKEAFKILKSITKSANALFLGGQCQYFLGDYDNALIIFESALFKYGFSEEEYKIKFNKKNMFYLLDKIFAYVFDIVDESLNPKIKAIQAANCLKWIASCYYRKGNPQNSLRCAELLKTFIDKYNLPAYEINMLIADIYELIGVYNQANAYMLAATKECTSVGQKLNLLILLAENEMKTGNYPEALVNWKKSQEIAELLFDSSHETNIKIAMNIGDCYFYIKDYTMAQKFYEDLCKNTEDSDYNKIIIYKKSAVIYEAQKQVELGVKAYDAALSLAAENNIKTEEADLYYEKGMLYYGTDNDKAIACLEKCLDIRKALLHLEDKQIINCQQQLLLLYQQKYDALNTKLLKKQVEKATSKIDFTMLFTFVLLVTGSIFFTFSIDSFFNPSANLNNALLESIIYVVGIIFFILTFKLNIDKFTKSFKGALITYGILFITILVQMQIIDVLDKTTTIRHESNFTNLGAEKIFNAIYGFDLHSVFYLIPMLIFTWFIAYEGFLNHKPVFLFASIIFTLLVNTFLLFYGAIIVILLFIIVFVRLLIKNTNDKWLQSGKTENFLLLISFLMIFLLLFLNTQVGIELNTFLYDLDKPISVLNSLNLFSPSDNPVTLIYRRYPILYLMLHSGIITGLLLATVYFFFVFVSWKNAPRIKSGYLRTVYQTICVFFLITGVLNVLLSLIEIIIGQTLSKTILIGTISFPFLSPNPIFLISNFFFAGILFSIYYNRVKEKK